MKFKKIVNRIIYAIILKIYNFLIIFFKVKSKNFNKIFIFDIDNTIANSWITFNEEYYNENERLKNIKPFKSMRKLIFLLRKKYNTNIIFLSARNIKYYFLTLKWLKNNSFLKRGDLLILVNYPFDKLIILKKIRKFKKKLIIFDDLSFNHEKGEIRFYSSLINEYKNYSDIYIDYSCIKTLQNMEENEIEEFCKKFN